MEQQKKATKMKKEQWVNPWNQNLKQPMNPKNKAKKKEEKNNGTRIKQPMEQKKNQWNQTIK